MATGSTMGASSSDSKDEVLSELLLPDADLMGSPEGDVRGLRELQQAARDLSKEDVE